MQRAIMISVMMHNITKRLPFLLLFISISFLLTADDRTENIDVFLVVDKSLSMEEEIEAVKSYINESIIDELLIPGDNFVVIIFYGEAEVLLEGTVSATKTSIFNLVSYIEADGRFTDIGNALDKLKTTLPLLETEGNRKYLLLITDGIQEAPPQSPYYSPDGSFNHEFLENTKEIVMEGWKIHILGIGSSTAAKEIAEELSGTYSEVSETPTKEELAAETAEFLGIVEQIDTPSLSPIGKSGKSKLTIHLTSSGYSSARSISIIQATIDLPDGTGQKILAEPVSFSIEPDETKDVKIDVQFTSIPDSGRHTGNVIFVFEGDTAFSPAVSTVEYRVKGFLGNNIWIFPVGVLALAALAFLGLLIPRLLSGGGSISFVCTVDDGTVRKKQYKLKYADKLYLIEGMMGLTMTEKPGGDPAAEISADGTGLHLTILDEKGYKPAEPIPDDVLPGEITLVKKYGKKAKITFAAP